MAKQGALIFIFDSKYLLPFKVLMHSMRIQLNKTPDIDIVILTDDIAVANDQFVKNFVDRVIEVSEEQTSFLKSIDFSGISNAHRHPVYGAYWFLKFFIFDDYGYEYHIYMDVDMLCISDSFTLHDLHFGKRFAVAPTVGPAALSIKPKTRGEYLDEPGRDEVLKSIKKIANRDYPVSRSFNSGVMYIPRDMIGRSTVEGLVREAAENAFRLEQDTIRQYAEIRSQVPFKSLPIWFNFPELPALAVGSINYEAHLKKHINIIHFNLHPKPWDAGRGSTWVHSIWWRHHDLATRWIKKISKKSWLSRFSEWMKKAS